MWVGFCKGKPSEAWERWKQKGWVSQWGRVRRASRELGLEGGGRCMAMVGLSVERGRKEKIASFSIRIISGQVFNVFKAVRIMIAMQYDLTGIMG